MENKIQKNEYEALAKFRERIADLLPTFTDYQKHDLWLLRWLRARELNQQKSEDMLRKSTKWREMNNLDELLKWQPPDYIDIEFPVYTPGYDKEDCFATIVPFGNWDVKKACSMGLKLDVIKYVGQLFENLMKFLEFRSNKEQFHYQFVIILDYENFSLKQLTSRDTLDAISDIVKNFEVNYPETLKAAYVINAPKYFEILFAIIKPLLTARTMGKIHVYGNSGWREVLLKTFHPDHLPSNYGGSNTSIKEYKVRYGFDVIQVHEIFPESDLMGIVVEAGMKQTVQYQLSTGSTLCWNFRTDNYDIGFELQFQPDGVDPEKSEILFCCPKADSHLHLQKGSVVADRPGTYTLVLDNSKSRLRSKNVYYAVRVKTPL